MLPPLVSDKVANDVWVKDKFIGNGTRPGKNKTHWNRWCKQCLQAEVDNTLKANMRHFGAGEVNVFRTPETIQAEILTHPDTMLPRALVSKLDVLITHLTTCAHIEEGIQQHAQLLKAHRRSQAQVVSASKENGHQAGMTAAILAPTQGPAISRSSTVLLASHPSSIPSTSSLSCSPTKSLLKRSCSDNNDSEDSRITPPFPPQLLGEFQADFCKLLLAGNCAFRLTELPFWQHFFQKWLPGAELPSRHAVSGRILDSEASRVLDGMKAHLSGRYATGQSDGWKSIAKTSIIASMVNAEYEPYILHSHDVSDQPKTAENLLKIVDAEIVFCEDVLKIILAAWCTDGGGDCAKMRRLLQQKRPDLATPHCWSHQIHLTVGDYLKAKTPMVDVLDTALEAIKWFNNHTGALAVLRLEQQKQYDGKVLALIRPAPTRWTAHYRSASRLLDVEQAICICIVTSRTKLLTSAGKEHAQTDKARELLDQLERPAFWSMLRLARTHLEPLAIAANATQGDNARLDVILVTLGALYHTFCDTTRFDPTVRFVMHQSLEARWKKAGSERELYILALILNPFLRLSPFWRNNPSFTRQALWLMFKRNYECMEKSTVDTAMYSAFVDYLSGIGEWSDEAMGLEQISALAERDGCPVNMMDVWRGVSTHDSGGANGIVNFAQRLFAIVPNSTGVERLFSLLGVIQTKHRNRLGVEKARKVVLVKADINRTYGNGRYEQHCLFNHAFDTSGAELDAAELSPSNPDPEEPTMRSDETVTMHVDPLPAAGDAPPSGSSLLHAPSPSSFHSIAAELFDLLAEDATDEGDGSISGIGSGISSGSTQSSEPTMLSNGSESLPPTALENSLPLAAGLPVPRGPGSLQLRHIFAYPPVTDHSTPVHDPLRMFWKHSWENLHRERDMYESSQSSAV